MKKIFTVLSAAVFSILLFTGCPQTTSPEPAIITPVSLKPKVYDGMVRVSWVPMVNAKTYVLYRDGKYLATKQVGEYRAAITTTSDMAFYDWIAEDLEYKDGDTVEYAVLAINRSDPASADLADLYKDANSLSRYPVKVRIPERGTFWKKPAINHLEYVRGSYDSLPATSLDFLEVGFNNAFDSNYTVKVFSGASDLIKDPVNTTPLYSYQLNSAVAVYGRIRFPAFGGPVTVYLVSNYDGTTSTMYYASISDPASKEIALLDSAGLNLTAYALSDGKIRVSWRNLGSLQYKLYRALNANSVTPPATTGQIIAGDFIQVDTSAAKESPDGFFVLDYTPEIASASLSFAMVIDNGTAKSLPAVAKVNTPYAAPALYATKNYNGSDSSVLLNWEYNPNATYTLTRARMDKESNYNMTGATTVTNSADDIRKFNADIPAYTPVAGNQRVVDINGKKWVRVVDTVDNRFAGYVYQLQASYGSVSSSYDTAVTQNQVLGRSVLTLVSGSDKETGKQILSWIGKKGVTYELQRAVHTDVFPGTGSSLDDTYPYLEFAKVHEVTGTSDGREHRYEDTIAEAERNKKYVYRLIAKTGIITTASTTFVTADYTIPAAGTLTATLTKDFDTSTPPTKAATVSLEWGAEAGITYKMYRARIDKENYKYAYGTDGMLVSTEVIDGTSGALKIEPPFNELAVITPVIIKDTATGNTYAKMVDTIAGNEHYTGAYLYKVVSVNNGVEGKPAYALLTGASFAIKTAWIDYTAGINAAASTDKMQFTLTVNTSYPVTDAATIKGAVTSGIELYSRENNASGGVGNFRKLNFDATDITFTSASGNVSHSVTVTTRETHAGGGSSYIPAYKPNPSSALATELSAVNF